MGVTFLVSPISLIIMNRVGFQCLILTSIFLCVTSLITSSFVTKIELFPITYSLLWGTGTGFANHASMVLIQNSFDKKLSAANGVAMSGTGFGALILGQILNWLLNNIGFRWTLRVCGLVPLLFTTILYSNYLANKNKQDQYMIKKNEDSDKTGMLNQTSEKQQLSSLNSTSRSPITIPKGNDREILFDGNENIVVHYRKGNSTTQVLTQKRKTPFFSEICDKDIWRNKRYVIFVFGISIFLFGSFIPFIFLVSIYGLYDKSGED